MLNGTEKVPPLITDFKEYHTDTTVRFVVKMSEEKLREAEAAGFHKVFKLQNSLTCNSMVMDPHPCDILVTVNCDHLVPFLIPYVLGFRFFLTMWAA